MKLNTIMSWQTFKKKFNPTMNKCHDGVLPITFSISPTLVNNGFSFIGDFTEYELPKKPKEIAIDIYEEFMTNQVLKPTGQIVVYFVHYGSRTSTMPIVVSVYMGLANSAKKKAR